MIPKNDALFGQILLDGFDFTLRFKHGSPERLLLEASRIESCITVTFNLSISLCKGNFALGRRLLGASLACGLGRSLLSDANFLWHRLNIRDHLDCFIFCFISIAKGDITLSKWLVILLRVWVAAVNGSAEERSDLLVDFQINRICGEMEVVIEEQPLIVLVL